MASKTADSKEGWKGAGRENGENPWSFEALVHLCIEGAGDQPGEDVFVRRLRPQRTNSRNGAPGTGLFAVRGQGNPDIDNHWLSGAPDG